mmetsp:Transcript_21697/g.34038  ORF Transcript_21697/g.34038 Transcript_21697/m.34038 type:complete len:346 (-) Transcript_21697:140-1177(-)
MHAMKQHKNITAVFFITLIHGSVFSFTAHQRVTNNNHNDRSPDSRSIKGTTTSLHYADDNNTSGSGHLSKKAYNDDALFQFHMMTQKQKIRDYSAMDTYVNTESLWNLAWHDSFVRNGLMDFVPPLTDNLSVLVVGNRFEGPTSAVGEIEDTKENQSSTSTESNEEDLDTDDSTVLRADATNGDASTESSSLTQQQSQDSSCSFLAAVFSDDNTSFDEDESSTSSSSELQFTSYDCIMDKGVMADLCASAGEDSSSNNFKNKKDIARLLYEATKRIRESGIYVANTQPMSFETKEYLTKLGEYLGLQWEFDLDGISDDCLSVSVARKFGSCPTIGWQSMAKMIED